MAILTTLLTEISKEEGYTCAFYLNNRVAKISNNRKSLIVYEHFFDINGWGSGHLSMDKEATFKVLEASGINSIPHRTFLFPPAVWMFSSQTHSKDFNTETLENLLNYAAQYDYNVVVKPPFGTAGNSIIFVKNKAGLSRAVINLIEERQGVCISPYMDFADEYRAVVINKQVRLIYKKDRPCIIGNGISTVKDLVIDFFNKTSNMNIVNFIEKTLFVDNRVPIEGEVVLLTHQHNLSHGATASLIVEETLSKKLEHISIKAADALNLSFACVDILSDGNDIRIVEVNSGVTMERFIAQFGSYGRSIAKDIYREGIKFFLEG